MTEVFREVRRVLKPDGILWLNLGDCYNAYNGGAGPSSSISRGAATTERPRLESGFGLRTKNLKPKDLVGIPWRVAFALQDDGWYLRRDIIWHKPNPMPESVTDRCTSSHEYIFMFTMSERYYYDAEAIKEPSSLGTHPRRPNNGNGEGSWNGSSFNTKKTGVNGMGRNQSTESRKLAKAGSGIKNNSSFDQAMNVMPETRNKRSVWTISTQPYAEAHYATFPEWIPEICIKAGSKPGDIVLDPFFGSGTVGMVAERLNRRWVGIDLGYQEMQGRRMNNVQKQLHYH